MGEMKRRNLSQKSEMVYDLHNHGVILDTREIWLCSDQLYHYNDAMLDHMAANAFVRNLRLLNNMSDDPILIHMITCGGDWNYGMAIYDAIKASESEITLLAYAHARSMSSIIPQAATHRVMMPHTEFLIHWGSMGYEGNHSSFMAEADQARRNEQVMVDCYVERCQESDHWKTQWKTKIPERISKYLRDIMSNKQEVYFTAREAVEMGFMDAVLGDPGYETIAALRDEA